MKIVILKMVKEGLDQEDTRVAWCDSLELRQRLYVEQFGQALILDKFDLIADHILLYSRQGQAMAYMRSLTSDLCQNYGQELPLLSLRTQLSAVHQESIEAFMRVCSEKEKTIFQMSYLCLDVRYRDELEGVKILDFLTWIAFQVSGFARPRIAYCSSPNAKYHLKKALDAIGPSLEILPPFVHPVIPEPHELFLIPEVSSHFWENGLFKYQKHLGTVVYLGTSEVKNKAA